MPKKRELAFPFTVVKLLRLSIHMIHVIGLDNNL